MENWFSSISGRRYQKGSGVGLSASEIQGTCPMKQQIRSTVTLAITGHLTSLPMLLYPMQLPLDAVG